MPSCDPSHLPAAPLQSGAVDARELEHLCRWPRAAAPPALSDELAHWVGEAQWAALAALAQLPVFGGLLKDLEKSGEEWEKWAASEAPEAAPLPGALARPDAEAPAARLGAHRPGPS